MKKESGFTLGELMVTLAIVGIVMAFAIPSMQTFVKNERLTTQINTLVSHLAYARSLAVTRRQQVILCASDNTTSCSDSGNWGAGWILFIDVDNNSGFTALVDEILRVKQALAGGNTLVSSPTISSIIYDNRGFAPNSGGRTFSLCDDRGWSDPYYVKSITISNTGRVHQGGSASC